MVAGKDKKVRRKFASDFFVFALKRAILLGFAAARPFV